MQVFPPETSQEKLYGSAVSSIVEEVLEGFNCTIFACASPLLHRGQGFGGGRRLSAHRTRSSTSSARCCDWPADPLLPRPAFAAHPCDVRRWPDGHGQDAHDDWGPGGGAGGGGGCHPARHPPDLCLPGRPGLRVHRQVLLPGAVQRGDHRPAGRGRRGAQGALRARRHGGVLAAPRASKTGGPSHAARPEALMPPCKGCRALQRLPLPARHLPRCLRAAFWSDAAPRPPPTLYTTFTPGA